MPFVNESGNADLEYLSDGVTESLINNLSQLTNLSVKGRSSVFQYKSKEISPQQVASELKVQAVLNGRVTQRGDSLSISLDLVDGTTGDQIWGEQYIRPAGDLAALQSDIARDVSQKLRTRLSGADESRVVKNQTQNTEAYQLYLKGRYNWNKRTDAAMKKAIEYFLQATEKDPNYAMAFVGLAESYLLSPLSTDELKATVAARRAIEIDPLLGEPHATLAVVLKDSHDFKGAENEFRRAIELAPNYPTSYHWLGEMLTQDARFEEGFAEYQKALELDPLSLAIATDYGQALYNDKQYDHAVEYLKGLLEIDPSYVRTHSYLAQVYRAMGRYEDAIDEDHRAAILLGTDPEEAGEVKRQLTQALRAGGAKGYWTKKLELAQQDLQKGRVVAATDMAAIYAQTGNRDEAFQWLEKALQAHEGDVPTLKVGPEWQNLRGDPRLSDLIRRAGLSAPNGS